MLVIFYAVAPLITLFAGLGLFLLAVLADGSMVGTVKLPKVRPALRAIVLVTGLFLIGFGVLKPLNITPNTPSLIDKQLIEHLIFEKKSSWLRSPGVVYAQSQQPIESFTVEQHHAIRLTKAPFSGDVAFAVGDVHLFRATDVILFKDVQKIAPATQQIWKVTLQNLRGAAGKQNLLAERGVRQGDQVPFSYSGRKYSLNICKVQWNAIGSDYISAEIALPGPGC